MAKPEGALGSTKTWLRIISQYKTPSIPRSVWQLVNTFIPYAAVWVLMIWLLPFSWWIILPLSVIGAGLMMRLFIIFHDCGHGAFFESKIANDSIGILLGIITFTPYYRWHHAHLIHHRTSGNLDKRGVGDVWTMTVEEFHKAPPKRQLMYRIYRNPSVMFLIGAPLVFLVTNRLTRKGFSRKERISVYVTNLGIAALATGLSLLIGFKAYLLIQLPIMYLASVIGVYLFYVQHQFPDVHWYRDEEWDYSTVAVQGASYLKLPKLLQWFSGNIGFHHIHHLSSKIPNYRLEQCHFENELFHAVEPVTLRKSWHTLRLRLWDEKNRRLVTFREAAESYLMKLEVRG